MATSIADALPMQIDRVTAKRDRWIKIASEHPEMAAGMNLSIALMQHEISAAVKATSVGDVCAMLSAHEALAAYADDE